MRFVLVPSSPACSVNNRRWLQGDDCVAGRCHGPSVTCQGVVLCGADDRLCALVTQEAPHCSRALKCGSLAALPPDRPPKGRRAGVEQGDARVQIHEDAVRPFG